MVTLSGTVIDALALLSLLFQDRVSADLDIPLPAATARIPSAPFTANAQLKHIAVGEDGIILAGDQDGFITSWKSDSGKPRWSFRAISESDSLSLCLLSNNQAIALGRDGSVSLLDFSNGLNVSKLKSGDSPYSSVACSPDKAYLACGTRSGEITIYACKDWKIKTKLTGHKGRVVHLAFTFNGKFVVSVDNYSMLRISSVDTLENKSSEVKWGAAITALCASPIQNVIAVGDQAGSVKICDTAGATTSIRDSSDGPIEVLQFSKDGEMLGWNDPTNPRSIVLSRLANGKRIGNLCGPRPVSSLRFFPIGNIAVTSNGNSLHLWNLETLKEVGASEYRGELCSIIWTSPDTIITSTRDNTLREWTLKSPAIRRSIQGGTSGQVAHSGSSLYAADASVIRQIDLASFQGKEFCATTAPVRGLALSGDGSVLAFAPFGMRVSVTEIATGKILHEAADHRRLRTTLCLDSRGRVLVIGGPYLDLNKEGACPVSVIAIDSGKARPGFSMSDDQMRLAGFQITQNDQYLIGFGSRGITMWSLQSGQEKVKDTNLGAIEALALSPNEKYLICGGSDYRLQIWDLATAARVRTYALQSRLSAVAFSPDARFVALGFSDGSISVIGATELVYPRRESVNKMTVEQLWKDIASRDPRIAYGAISDLFRADNSKWKAMPDLRPDGESNALAERCMRDLDNDNLEVRMSGYERLVALDTKGDVLVRALAAQNIESEACRLATRLIETVEETVCVSGATALQRIRLLQLLEECGQRELLEELFNSSGGHMRILTSKALKRLSLREKSR